MLLLNFHFYFSFSIFGIKSLQWRKKKRWNRFHSTFGQINIHRNLLRYHLDRMDQKIITIFGRKCFYCVVIFLYTVEIGHVCSFLSHKIMGKRIKKYLIICIVRTTYAKWCVHKTVTTRLINILIHIYHFFHSRDIKWHSPYAHTDDFIPCVCVRVHICDLVGFLNNAQIDSMHIFISLIRNYINDVDSHPHHHTHRKLAHKYWAHQM